MTTHIPHILSNCIVTPDGTKLQSFHRHDYKEYVDKNGETYMVDGGFDYLRRNINTIPAIECSVYSTSKHATIRQTFCWGTRGKDGKSPLQWKPIQTLELSHIEAILETQLHIKPHIRTVFENELAYRINSITGA
jgi:hypothetical protein